MSEALSQLNCIHTIIETDESLLSRFVIAFQYGIYRPSSYNRDESQLTIKKRRLANHDLEGTLSVTVGSIDTWWWGVSLDGHELTRLITTSGGKKASSPSSKPMELTEQQCQQFVDKILTAFNRQSIMIGMKQSARNPDGSWPSIKLYIDVEQDPIRLKLNKLDDRLARIRTQKFSFSARAILHPTPPYPNQSQTTPKA